MGSITPLSLGKLQNPGRVWPLPYFNWALKIAHADLNQQLNLENTICASIDTSP